MPLERPSKRMDRTVIKEVKNDVFCIGDNLTSNSLLLDCSILPNKLTIKVSPNVRANLLIINMRDNNNIQLVLEEYASLHLAILAQDEANNLKIHANLEKYAEIDGYLADFLIHKNKSIIEVDLNGEEAACAWHLASLASEKDEKEFDVSVYHNAPNTYCKLDNYGVCLGESKLTFSGICKINKGNHGSKAHQNARIMVFDEACRGIAKPILKIDENDIEASHAAVAGKINDDHLFYLTSRGLSEAEAKELITMGYLKPILKGFDDEQVKETIAKMIEERM